MPESHQSDCFWHFEKIVLLPVLYRKNVQWSINETALISDYFFYDIKEEAFCTVMTKLQPYHLEYLSINFCHVFLYRYIMRFSYYENHAFSKRFIYNGFFGNNF